MSQKRSPHLIIIIGIIATSKIIFSQGFVEQSVLAFSEGSDCRCKCILSTRDGGPCNKDWEDGPRKTAYEVETVSGGDDCRCSCNTPPPVGCEPGDDTPPRRGSKSSVGDLSNGQSDSKKINSISHIDLVELHSSITNMVAAMLKIERAVKKDSTPGQKKVLKKNVQKVVDDLKSANGSYEDLISDLKLEDMRQPLQSSFPTERTSNDTSSNIDIPPLREPEKSEDSEYDTVKNSAPREYALSDSGKKTTRFLDKFLKNLTSYRSTRETTSVKPLLLTRTNAQATISFKTAATLVVMSQEHRREPDIIPVLSTQREISTAPKSMTTNFVTTTTITTTDVPTTKNKVMSTSTEKVTTQSVTTEKLLKPELIFFPYRKKEPEKKPNIDEKDEYEYNYDEDFDQVDDATTESDAATAVPSFITTMPVPKNITQGATTALPANRTTAATTQAEITAQEDYDDSYDDDDDYWDEYYDETEDGDYEYDEFDTARPTTEPTTVKKEHDRCGTLLSFSKPKMVSHFGRREGAWMKDPIYRKNDPYQNSRIYVANFYYGNILMEFANSEGLRTLSWIQTYHLPHKWIGTGHIVYNGSFYYNRAFSRSLIKYNLQYRFVSAWSHLANAIYEPTTPFSWRGHSMVHMAADEEGLWVIFPSEDPFNPGAKLTYVINKIDPIDLRTMKSFKSKIRQSVSHVFMACGIVYSTDRYNTHQARVTHAFDTRTSTQTSFYVGFENLFAYSVQLLYNPKERKIYSWDNGRQVEYYVTMIY